MRFARLIEKNIFAGSIANQGFTSPVLCLDGAEELSVQLVQTVSSPVGCSVQYQYSNDGIHWTDDGSASITANGGSFLNVPNVAYRFFRAVKVIGSGSADIQAHVLVKGDAI
jgi:hypothetical protein